MLGACSGDEGGSEARYCTTVGENLTALGSPTISTPDDVDRTVALYRKLRDSAPLAIEAEWSVLVGSIETAAAVDPADPESIQRAADTARASQQAANRVMEYTQKLCGVSFGQPPIVTAPAATTG